MSQKELVRKHLEQGYAITPAKALAEYGIWRLAAVIHKLSVEGMTIERTNRKSLSGKPYTEYRICREKLMPGEFAEIVDDTGHNFKKGDVVRVVDRNRIVSKNDDCCLCELTSPFGRTPENHAVQQILFPEQLKFLQ